MINLLTTNSYFNMFDILIDSLKEKPNSIDSQKIIFCEEKVSLMIERMISYKLKGSFNVKVYSFGNFLRKKKPIPNLLTKEGSAMALKSILSNLTLNCFKASKDSIAPTLYDLIIQLKSAKISPSDIKNAIDKTSGILKNKLIDIFEIYSCYEKFISDNNFEDQSSVLSYLPDIILNSQEIENSSIYLVGFSGFTAQIRSAIDAIFNKSNDISAILCEGDNPLTFVNETCEYIKEISKKSGYPFIYKKIETEYNSNAKIIIDNLFNPLKKGKEEKALIKENNVFCSALPNMILEVENVAEIIKKKIIMGECRYKDIAIAIPDDSYDGYIKSVFNNLEIPFFLDQRKKPIHHPLIKLIISYIEVFRKNFEREAVLSFIKNPYFCQDKNISDRIENYLIKFNINYSKITKPFVNYENFDIDIDSLNLIMDKFRECFNKFDIERMLKILSVEELCQKYKDELNEINYYEEGAINAQIYDSVINILSQMKMLLGGLKLSLNEYKNIFISGINALEISIIPQYNDAVFVGGYKEIALGKAKYLFAIGLTNAVPSIKADISLLSDSDIDALEQIKLLVEPKIKIVNHRTRESVALALSAFDKQLYLSYPSSNFDGGKNIKSEIILCIENLIDIKPCISQMGYLTKKQALKTFAKECGEFADGIRQDFVFASSFYEIAKDEFIKDLLSRADKEMTLKINASKILIKEEISPTTIEDYYRCPYKSFLSHALKLKKREIGYVDTLSVGNLMHEIFNIYAKNMHLIEDEKTSDQVFLMAKEQVLNDEKYQKFLSDSQNSMTIDRIIKECQKYSYKTFLSLSNSKFKIKHSEASFGEGKIYPAIKLLGGKIKIKGKIDRIDESQNYFRIIDYKTGSTDSTDKGLFSGTKLQLFLYAKSVLEKYKDGEKQIAGLYYLPVSDKYVNQGGKIPPMADGRTLDDKTAILEQDINFFDRESLFLPNKIDAKGNIKDALKKEEMSKYIDYAIKTSELAAEQLQDGIIVASPYDRTCEYCEFKGMCPNLDGNKRQLKSVNSDSILGASQQKNIAKDEGEEL